MEDGDTRVLGVPSQWGRWVAQALEYLYLFTAGKDTLDPDELAVRDPRCIDSISLALRVDSLVYYNEHRTKTGAHPKDLPIFALYCIPTRARPGWLPPRA